MELANRLDLESTLAAKLSRLYGSHRRKIVAALKATGDPINPKKIPASLWSQIESETQQQLAEEILVIYLLVLAASSDSLSLGLQGSTQQRMADAYSLNRSKEIAEKMTDHSRERIEGGADPLDVFGPDRAATVARSEVGVAQAYGSIDSVRGPEGESDRKAAEVEQAGTATIDEEPETEEPETGSKKKTAKKSRLPPEKAPPKRRTLVAFWRHSHIRPKGHAGAAVNPCKICTPMLNRPESQWNGLVPGSAHPNCILPGNQIRAFGKITAAAKSFYDGICIELRLDCGARLTCTANHPILTPAGWKAAHLIEKGSNVFRAADSEWPSPLVDPNANQIPTAIEEVFAAIKMSSGMPACRVPASAKQFHGDGLFLKGEVEIVYSDRLLASWNMPQFENQLMESILNSGITSNRFLSGSCPNCAGDFASRLSANSGMGCGNLPKPFRSGHFFGANQSSLAVRANFNPSIEQVFSKRCPGNSQRIGNSIFGFPRFITGHDSAGDGNLSVLPTMLDADTSFGNPSSNHANIYAERSRKFLDRFASLVSKKQVINVRRFHYSGHVYDLQVEDSHVYSASSIAVSNCDCYIEWASLNDNNQPSAN